MSNPRWTVLTHSSNTAIPSIGELILIPYPIRTIPFSHGPASIYVPSVNQSHTYSTISTTPSRTPKKKYAIMHYVLVVDVRNDVPNKLHLEFMPIMSYSSQPSGLIRPASLGVWSAERWMYHEATDIQRLNHLPVPATGWDPPPSVPSAPSVSFGGWRNSRPSWIAMCIVSHELDEGSMWCRHPSEPVIMDGSIGKLVIFALRTVPGLERQIAATATADAATATATATATASNTTDAVVNNVTLPTYSDVWSGFINEYPFNAHAISLVSLESSQCGSVSDRDLAPALAGEDRGVGRLPCQDSPVVPAEWFALAQEHQKCKRDQFIIQWDEGCSRSGAEADMEIGEIPLLELSDIAFGESACPEA